MAGFIKPGETAEETAVREVREEIGLEIDKIEYAGTYWYIANEQLMHGFMPKGHAPALRYMTTNKKVATVSAGGKITAKGKGTCTVIAFAHNGVSKQIKVTVK